MTKDGFKMLNRVLFKFLKTCFI